MTLSAAQGAYKDCYDIFDRALASPAGIAIRMETEQGAQHLRHRLNRSRVLDREQSEHGTSDYDHLFAVIRPNSDGWYVIIRPREVAGEITDIPPDFKLRKL